MSKDPKLSLADPAFEGWAQISAFEKVERLLELHGKASEGEERFQDPLYHATPSSTPLRLETVTLPTPTTSQITFLYKIPAFFTNGHNNLHGAAHALIYDNCTTLALAPLSTPGLWMIGGVSRVLEVKYFRPVPVGLQVRIECEVLNLGKRMVALRGTIKDEQGRVLSTCEHDKMNVDPSPEVKGKL